MVSSEIFEDCLIDCKNDEDLIEFEIERKLYILDECIISIYIF